MFVVVLKRPGGEKGLEKEMDLRVEEVVDVQRKDIEEEK